MEKLNIVEKLIGVNREYITLSPEDFKKGHGGSLSVKIVLPCYCQAHCEFCFNNLTTETQEHDYDLFFENITQSLDMIFDNVTDRPITLDITGNEPTFDVLVFKRLMQILKKYKAKAEKIVLTSNGYKLKELLADMGGVVDIVNISVHHYNDQERTKIFGTPFIPKTSELEYIVSTLKNIGTTCTAVVVLYKDYEDFMSFYDAFGTWARNLGFKDVRMRSNFCANDEFIEQILNIKMENESINVVGGLTTKIIVDEKTGFETYILKGVPDLTEYVVGAELIIDDNGQCYIDYNKRFPVTNENINNFNNLYIFTDDPVFEKDSPKRIIKK